MVKGEGKRGGGIFAAMGAATGLGNAFRFPALCAEYGAAFILVYALSLAVVCYPLLCAELSLGKAENLSKKEEKARRVIFKAAAVNSALIAAYYGVIAVKLAASSACFALTSSPELPRYAYVLAALPVFALVCLILSKGSPALGISGKVSVCLSFALFVPLAVVGLCAAPMRFDAKALICGAAWSDGLGQSLLSLSLAAGVMPAFARSQPEDFSPAKAAAKIIAANFCGCLAAAFATLPFASEFAEGGGVSCAFTVFPQVIYSVAKSYALRRLFGGFAYLALSAVAIHSLSSLAYPSVGCATPKIKYFPALFCLASVALAPVFAANNCEILNACDRAACCISAVVIAFAECLYFAKTAHIRGVTAFLIKFVCLPCCAAVAVLSLCSARFTQFSPYAAACGAVAALIPVVAAIYSARPFGLKRRRCRPVFRDFN